MYTYLAIHTTWNWFIPIAYILFLTKLQKRQTPKKDLPYWKTISQDFLLTWYVCWLFLQNFKSYNVIKCPVNQSHLTQTMNLFSIKSNQSYCWYFFHTKIAPPLGALLEKHLRRIKNNIETFYASSQTSWHCLIQWHDSNYYSKRLKSDYNGMLALEIPDFQSPF